MNKIQKEELINKLYNELPEYKHKFSGKIRFDDVDSFGVVHNIKYLYWLEWARQNYFEFIGIKLNSGNLYTEFPVMVVHSEIDYFGSAVFNEEYEIYSKISFIRGSSLGFDNIICLKENKIIAKAAAVLVNMDYQSKKPANVPENIKNLILNFDKNVIIY